MSVTDTILSKTNRLTKQPEISPGDHGFEMFNDAGTEVEVSEFLYSFVRMVKPDLILETGTHIGVSSTFMGLALKENKRGKLITFEIIPQHYENAPKLWAEVGVIEQVEGKLQDALQFDHFGLTFDILFLDSEPQLRFNEFLKFFDALRPGGFILIHDLHPSMGHSGQIVNGMYDWPYGDFREKLGPYLKERKVQTIHFSTPRGLTLFQKVDPNFEAEQYLSGASNV